MKARILSRWTVQRWLYLILGVIIIAQAIADRQWMLTIAGGYFAAMAVFNFGCATGGCYGNSCRSDSTVSKSE